MIDPEELAKHYTRFRVSQRILLTGHSHQAWPDVAFEAQQQAWLDAAEYVDDVWEKAFEKANEVRRGFARLLDDTPERIALAPNTHELVVRFLSALPLGKRPQLVTTDGEFHTIRRQLDRLAEEGIEVIKVPAMPAATLAERLAISVDDRTAAVLVLTEAVHSRSLAFDQGISSDTTTPSESSSNRRRPMNCGARLSTSAVL